LPPGQAQATLGWAPSEGEVAQYFVYESRNGSPFNYSQAVPQARATVSGNAGDRVQIVVIAANDSNQLSNSSPPSPQLVFQGNAQAVTSLTDAPSLPSASPAALSQASSSGSSSTTDATGTAQAAGSLEDPVDVAAAPNANEADSSEAATGDETDLLSTSMRELLVEADARFPTAGLSDEADAWLQSKLDEEFSAGVRLVGTGLRNADAFRELIWQDSAGQILVSDGQAVIGLGSTAEMPSTFEEAIRLRATERFIALVDFDGDAVGDWLIEDITTGEISIYDGIGLDAMDARTNDTRDAQLVGHGDFDDNGREELLWRSIDGRIHATTPTAPTAVPVEGFAIDEDSRVLGVADLDGDGRDDLLLENADGRIIRRMNALANESIRFDRESGPADSVSARAMLMTLDADEDGRADLAWMHDGELDLWDTRTGPRDF
jgi:hypothetical protein